MSHRGTGMTARLYVSDLDGTLLSSDARLSATSRAGLNHLLDAGSRSPLRRHAAPRIRALLAGVRLTLPVIELNGAFISELHSGRHVRRRVLAAEVADTAVRTLLDASLEPILTSWDGVDDHVYYDPGAQLNLGNAWYIRGEAMPTAIPVSLPR